MRRALFGDPATASTRSARRNGPKFPAGDLKSFHQKRLVPNNCVLAIYGDVKADEVKAAVEKALRTGNRVPGASANCRQIALPTPAPPASRSQRVEKPATKSRPCWSSVSPARRWTDDDRYALELMQECCSDLGSRLFLRIREQLGLAYYVGAQNLAGLVPGYFAFYTGTEPAKAAQVEKELLKEAELLRTKV
jgi:zinc protease